MDHFINELVHFIIKETKSITYIDGMSLIQYIDE